MAEYTPKPASHTPSKRDIPEAEVRFLDTGHFALETHAAEIGQVMREFLGARLG